ncbi:MAG: mevalonate kinase [Promethearchaeota archaeon]
MITASAPGKCILLGEHSVVYGYPAIAVALDIRSYCTIEKPIGNSIQIFLPDYEMDLNFPNIAQMQKQIPDMYRQFYEGLNAISKEYEIPIKNLSIRIYSDLWKGSGLGSSASTSIAFLATIAESYSLKISLTELNKIAFFMEKFVHGTPSGIDNTICSLGGALVYQNGVREKLNIPKFPILITHSGFPHNTGQIVNSIKEIKDNLENAFVEIEKITEKGIIALKKGEFSRLGELCNKNQEILSQMGLSTPEIDEIVSFSRDNGAFGSKLTGAGAGGSVITLGTKDILEEIHQMLQKKGFLSKICNLEHNGGRIDSN